VIRTIFAMALLVSCEPYDADPPHAPTLEAGVLAAQKRMHARYDGAIQMVEAIAHGDLDAAHAAARLVTMVEEPAVLARWKPYFDQVHSATVAVENATGIDTAAERVAVVGAACASCHQATKTRVTFPALTPPDDRASLSAHMGHHQWAALEMWEGLIGPSDSHWRAGATELTTIPSNLVARAATPASPDEIDDIPRIKLGATRALETTAQDTRAVLFGRLLATCAHCHATLRDR
jgi:cytochrome c553